MKTKLPQFWQAGLNHLAKNCTKILFFLAIIRKLQLHFSSFIYKLQVTSYKLQVISYKLQVWKCQLNLSQINILAIIIMGKKRVSKTFHLLMINLSCWDLVNKFTIHVNTVGIWILITDCQTHPNTRLISYENLVTYMLYFRTY